jgi:hypothetical protein
MEIKPKSKRFYYSALLRTYCFLSKDGKLLRPSRLYNKRIPYFVLRRFKKKIAEAYENTAQLPENFFN